VRAKEFTNHQGVAEGSGFDQEAGIGLDGQSFKFKIRDLVALAGKYPVTSIDPNQFVQQIKDRDEDPQQSMARAEKADLQYPIIVVQRTNGKLWIADGTHRAHKAILNKIPKIKAKIIPIKDMSIFAVKQDVNEAPLPPDWDKEQLNLRQTFKNRIKYAVSKAQRIGSGSSRVAFVIPYEGRNTVLKVAKNLKGLAQNEAEIQVLDDYVIGQSDIVIPLIDYDKDNKRPVWLQTELANQISMKPLLQLLRTPTLWFLTDAVKFRLGLPDKPKYLNKPADLKEKYFNLEMWISYGGTPTEQSFEIFNEYVDKLAELKDSSDMELGDLQNNLNWGQFMGRPVVIDLGLSSEVWQKMYKL